MLEKSAIEPALPVMTRPSGHAAPRAFVDRSVAGRPDLDSRAQIHDLVVTFYPDLGPITGGSRR